ncbi:MAG: hypothetical protein Kow0098_28840 [Ignavibacteriaceae bacterium]
MKAAVQRRAYKLGIRKHGYKPFRPYSPQEIILLKKHYPLKGAKYVAGLLGRSEKSVNVKAYQLRVKRKSIYAWNQYEIDYLKKWYNKTGGKAGKKLLHKLRVIWGVQQMQL